MNVFHQPSIERVTNQAMRELMREGGAQIWYSWHASVHS